MVKIEEVELGKRSTKQNTEQNNKDGGLIAFDGQKVVEIKSEGGQELKNNYFGYEIGTYYLSRELTKKYILFII